MGPSPFCWTTARKTRLNSSLFFIKSSMKLSFLSHAQLKETYFTEGEEVFTNKLMDSLFLFLFFFLFGGGGGRENFLNF